MPMSLPRSIALLLVSTLCAGRSHAQIPPVSTELRPWPTGEEWGSAGPFERFARGQLTDVPGREVVGLRDGRVFVIADPSAFDGMQRLDDELAGVRDLALLTGGGFEGRDAFVTVDPASGLVWHAYDPDQGAFVSQTLAAGDWQGAARLASGDLDGDGAADVLGAAGTQLLTRLFDAGGWSSGLAYTAATPITDLALVDYDADVEPDVALLTDAGLAVIDAAGTPFPFVPAAGPGGLLAVVPRATVPGDDLVWCTPAGAGFGLIVLDALDRKPTVLLEFAPQAGGVPQPVDPVGLVPADLSQDGRIDLVLCQRTLPQALVLRNKGTADSASFSKNEQHVERIPLPLSPGGSMAPNGATAAVFERRQPDEQDWIYYPVDSDDGAFAVMHAPGPSLLPPDGSDLDPSFSTELSSQPLSVQFDFSLPEDVPSSINALQVVLFEQCDPGQPVDPDALYNQVMRIDDPDTEVVYRAHVDLPGCGASPPPILYFIVSFVEASYDVPNKPVIEASYRLHAFALRYSTQQPDVDYLDTLPSVLVSYEVEDVTPSVGTYIGGVVLLDDIPIFGGPPSVPRPSPGPQVGIVGE